MVIDMSLVPKTNGRYYDYITEEEFAQKWEDKDNFDLEDLKVGGTYTFYRIAKNNEDEIVYMKISGFVIYNDGVQMIFTGYQDTKGKIMLLGGYKQHWFFEVDSPPKEDVQ